MATFSPVSGLMMIPQYDCVSKPCAPVVHIKIAGKWMFIPLKMVLIGIDPYPYRYNSMFDRGTPAVKKRATLARPV